MHVKIKAEHGKGVTSSYTAYYYRYNLVVKLRLTKPLRPLLSSTAYSGISRPASYVEVKAEYRKEVTSACTTYYYCRNLISKAEADEAF